MLMCAHNEIPLSNENEQSKTICSNIAESQKHKLDIKRENKSKAKST